MRLAFAVAMAVVCSACSVNPKDVSHDEPDGEGGGSGDGGSGGNECHGEVVETRLPGQHAADEVVTLCTECDDECDSAGDPCNMYGSACKFDGKEGVCGACCNGTAGELRCFPSE